VPRYLFNAPAAAEAVLKVSRALNCRGQSCSQALDLSFGNNFPNSPFFNNFPLKTAVNNVSVTFLQKSLVTTIRSGLHFEYPQDTGVLWLVKTAKNGQF
jgi:hypothetical protein